MKVFTPEEMRALDERTIEKLGIPGAVLMENAGRGVVKAVSQELSPVLNDGITVVCGPGNNGGDGLVAARYFLDAGLRVKVYLLGEKSRLSGDAELNLQLYTRLGGVTEELNAETLSRLERDLRHSGAVIDALYGTGLKKPVTGLGAEVIDMLNQSGKPVVAVDVPSGVDALTGVVRGRAVAAQMTVTMGGLKSGLLLYPGAELAGKIFLADIGIPAHYRQEGESRLELLEPQEVLFSLPPRAPDAHKGSCGRVLVLGGSPGYTGAAALSCEAAHRIGAGMVYLGIPRSLNALMEMKLTETITIPLPEEQEAGVLGARAYEALKGRLGEFQALALGPGLGRGEAQLEFCRLLLKENQGPLVVDADGLFHLPALKIKKDLPLVLTPHWGEMARLMGVSPQEIGENPLLWVRKAARNFRAVVVLKGPHSLIAEPEGFCRINPSGNSGMASAGMGDVLTGCIAGLLAQGMDAFSAASAGVYLHGFAGDIAAQELGSRGLIAGDLPPRLGQIPEMLQENVSYHPFPETVF